MFWKWGKAGLVVKVHDFGPRGSGLKSRQSQINNLHIQWPQCLAWRNAKNDPDLEPNVIGSEGDEKRFWDKNVNQVCAQ